MTSMEPQPDWRIFRSPAQLAQALAVRIATALRQAVMARGETLLAVSGGRTPELFLRNLSEQRLAWENVTVTLVDERFVDPTSERSNERLVRENLLRDEAEKAKFVGLHSDAPGVEEAAKIAGEKLSALPLPIDVAVLGMGLDGHTASFFPDAANLPTLLDPHSQAIVMPVHAPSAGEPRLTLSLARLVESRFIALHIEGDAKREALLSALRAPAGVAPPVRRIFEYSERPAQIYWAPNEDEIS